MADRDEIIRRIISGDMSRGGADFAARMMAQTMPAEQLQANARNAMIQQVVQRGQERARMLSLEPNMMGPEDELPSQADLDRRFQDQQALPYILPGRPPAGFGAGLDVEPVAAPPGADFPPQVPPQAGLGAPDADNAPGAMWTRDDLMPLPDQPFAPNMLPPEPTVGAYAPEIEGVPRGKAPVAQTAPGFEFMSGGIGMPEGVPAADINSLMFPGAVGETAPVDQSEIIPQAGLPADPAALPMPPVTSVAGAPGGTGGVGGGGTGGGIDMSSLPSGEAVSPSNPEAYNPETGTRPAEARALSVWDRMFGEPGTDRRAAMSQALMQLGAVMMSTNGDLGQALGAGIQAGLLEYDATMKALSEEAREARKMGMEEEAFEIEIELKKLQLARAKMGGGRGARTAGVVANPLDDFRTKVLTLQSLGYALTPEQINAGAAEAMGIDLPAAAYNAPKVDPLAALTQPQ